MGLWFRYFLLWPGAPVTGDPNDADSILVQAFGRNSVADTDLHRIRKNRDNCGFDYEMILKLRGGGCDPGLPNRQLAKICMHLVEKHRLTAIVQWEVAVAFDPAWYGKWRENIFCLWPPKKPGEYFTTKEVKEDSVRMMKKLGKKNPIELAHRRQIVRAALILKKILRREGFSNTVPIIVTGQPDSFDANSVQIWTRNPARWLLRESLARIHHLVFRYI
jgi:hypothetical protein